MSLWNPKGLNTYPKDAHFWYRFRVCRVERPIYTPQFWKPRRCKPGAVEKPVPCEARLLPEDIAVADGRGDTEALCLHFALMV